MKSKNILFILPSLRKGGAERVVSLLLNAWNKDMGFCHLMLTDDATITYDIPQYVQVTTLSHRKKNGLQKLVALPYDALKIAKYAKSNDINTIVSFLYRPNYSAVLSRFFGFKGRVVINIRSTTSRYLHEGLLGKVNLLLIRALFNKADLIISNSHGVDEDLKSLIHITTKTQVIYNPVDLNFINRQIAKCSDIHFEFEKDKKYIISVGRLIPLKRNSDLIEAFYEVQKKDDKLELLFLGDGTLKETLQGLCTKLKIVNKVHFLGNLQNPFYYLSRSDLFVLTSETEGFPNVLVEAMACGLPVISSDCKSGPREILQDEKYGLLYPVGDIKALIGKMKIFLYGDIDKDKIKQMNLKRIKDFDINKILKEFMSIL